MRPCWLAIGRWRIRRQSTATNQRTRYRIPHDRESPVPAGHTGSGYAACACAWRRLGQPTAESVVPFETLVDIIGGGFPGGGVVAAVPEDHAQGAVGWVVGRARELDHLIGDDADFDC
jgi:hypothetical protein